MNPLFKHVLAYAQKNGLLSPHQTVIVGLSGGPDSVFLLHVLLSVRESVPLQIIAAHLDHEWRESSRHDAAFCAQLCAQLQVPLVSMRASELGVTPRQNGSAEDVGRQLRRALFAHVKNTYKAQAIALAHHADDQVETLFMRLIRGASVAGLACMKARDGAYIRPLLNTYKHEILAYLHEHHIAFVIDPTNQSQHYLRNRIRACLPVFAAIDERALANTQRAITDLQATDAFLTRCTHTAYQKMCVAPGVFSLEKFFALDPFLQRRVVAYWLCHEHGACTLSSALIDEVIRFFAQTKSVSHQVGQRTVVKVRGSVQIV